MEQIGRSKYTARNQTICFKRTQELVKTSWNIAGKKAAATPIPEQDWHCSCSFNTVLFSPPALHCNRGENFILLPLKVLQNIPELGVPLFIYRKRKVPNHQDLTSFLRTGVLSPGHITVPAFFTQQQWRGKKECKRSTLPLESQTSFNDSTENPPSFNSSHSYLPRTHPFATWVIIYSLNQETPLSIQLSAP